MSEQHAAFVTEISQAQVRALYQKNKCVVVVVVVKFRMILVSCFQRVSPAVFELSHSGGPDK